MGKSILKTACAVAILLLAACGGGPGDEQAGQPDWRDSIRPGHPRLFFNSETWPAVRQWALTEERELYDKMKEGVDELAGTELEPGDYGTDAAHAALVFLVTEDDRYLELARGLLTTSIDYYHQCFREKRAVSWYNFSRIDAWAAYDWLWNHLPESERREIGDSFMEAVANVLPTGSWRGTREPFARENWSGPKSGFYGTAALRWYAGLAAWKEGIDDTLAAQWVDRGYELYNELLEYRSHNAGDDGGSASAALNYALAAYPWAEFNFFHTFRSATGIDITADWPYVAYLPGYIYWNWLPGGGRCFGWGDDYHITNDIRKHSLHIHLSQIIHLYSESMPRESAFASWLRGWVEPDDRIPFKYHRFLVNSRPEGLGKLAPPDELPLARHFENMGQAFFRSGSGPDDTYATFTAGGNLEEHKHFDHNNFAIYRNGFLALDTGTRPEPGQHLSHYFCRTVAHNCVTITMPGEEMPRYWGNPAPEEEPLPYPNDGGQQSATEGSEVVAFESNPFFAYVAGDATGAYSSEKCSQAVRQFVFLEPDFFVVFDRVGSADESYGKRWLLHTANEPDIEGPVFTAAHEQGRLFCRTVFPADARLDKVGGPGMQFMAGGRNWPLPESFRAPDTTKLLGQWRVEVRPGQPARDDFFLHLIQVGDRDLDRMVAAEPLSEPGLLGVSFEHGGAAYRVTFPTAGDPGGRVRITFPGGTVLDQPLSRRVQPQQGLFGM